jgi:hypothetical protein
MSEQPRRNQPATRHAHLALPPVASPRHPGPRDDGHPAGLTTAARSPGSEPGRPELQKKEAAVRPATAIAGQPASDPAARCGQDPAQPLDKGSSTARLRVFVCNFCSTAEVVPWCGQNPNCGHPECTEALARRAAPHRLDDRRFHGQVNILIVERQLWDRYQE